MWGSCMQRSPAHDYVNRDQRNAFGQEFPRVALKTRGVDYEKHVGTIRGIMRPGGGVLIRSAIMSSERQLGLEAANEGSPPPPQGELAQNAEISGGPARG